MQLDPKNRSAMRTWDLMLNFIPFGRMLSSIVSIWELNCYKWEVSQVVTIFNWEMYGRILFTYLDYLFTIYLLRLSSNNNCVFSFNS